jgi:hypothetical protein
MFNQAEARECIFSRFEIWAGGVDEAGGPGAFHRRKNTHYREDTAATVCTLDDKDIIATQ